MRGRSNVSDADQRAASKPSPRTAMASSPSRAGRRLTWVVIGVFAVQIGTLCLLWLLDAVFGTP